MESKTERYCSLSRIQFEVLERFSQGKSTAEIANELQLSELTVGITLESAMKKMGVNSLCQAAVMFRRSTCHAA